MFERAECFIHSNVYHFIEFHVLKKLTQGNTGPNERRQQNASHFLSSERKRERKETRMQNIKILVLKFSIYAL